jgi:carnitine O-acetyltransferase
MESNSNFILQAFTEHESKFPKIPVPPLKDTIQYYLNSIKAVSSKEEYAHSLKLVDNFMQTIGPRLQTRLIKKANKSKNWVVDVFSEKQPLTKLPYATNCSLLFNYKFSSQTEGAAKIIFTCLIIKIIIMKNQFQHITRLCPTMYYYLFHSCKIPNKNKDILDTYPLEYYNHVIVICKNSFYKLDVSFNYDYLITQIKQILLTESNNTIRKEDFIGVLTTQNREKWVSSRNHFLKLSPGNKEFLEEINSAMMIVCLEEDFDNQLSIQKLSEICWLSEGNNRYFDKTVQFIIFKDGLAALNNNRKVINGTISNEIIKFIVNTDRTYCFSDKTASEDRKHHINELITRLVDNGVVFSRNCCSPVKLNYVVDQKLRNNISEGYSNLKKKEFYHDVLFYTRFGRSTISQNYSIKIDSFIQMAIQYTYYKFFGKFPVVLQPVHTRKFYMGTTEAVRSLTLQSINFISSLVDKKAPNALKQRLGYAAFKTHFQQVINSSNGLGIDRHFEGLISVLYGEPLPELFKDVLYERSRRCDILTISFNTDYITFSHYFPPFYGNITIAYFIRSDRVDFTVTSKNDDCSAFLECLRNSMNEMFEIFYHKPKF